MELVDGAVIAVGSAVILIATIILAVLAVVSVVYLEVELEQKRQDLGNLFGS